MKAHVILFVAILAALWLGWTGRGHASADESWPVTRFISQQSVLANYYRDYLNSSIGLSKTSPAEKMHGFCQLLLDSDLLSDRLSMLGGKPPQMREALTELDAYQFDTPSQFSKEDRARIRGLLLTLDMNLEIIERGLATGTRSEFRREVLADVPPLNRVGSLPHTATQVMVSLLSEKMELLNMNII